MRRPFNIRWFVWPLALAAVSAFVLFHMRSEREIIPEGANRLILETSPYLQQHAYNPVDWYPWGAEAFEKARRENKPVFLSSGYSTCHWCHVMKRESFEDPEIAAFMNEHFVSIKIDREERPDVDRMYMTFLMATTGQGGWPMNVWLTPERKPFVGGLYFPPRDRPGQAGFLTVLQDIAEAWDTDRDDIFEQADHIMTALRDFAEHRDPAPDEIDIEARLKDSLARFRQQYDAEQGGFGRSSKFPQHSVSHLLARMYDRFEEGSDEKEAARDMLLHTLRRMAEGGLRDHLGGGFHRYAVDPAWRVPHFEKMLYDQAQHVIAYLEAYQITGDPFYKDVARETLAYVSRRLTHEAGGFYSAEDAESQRPDAEGPAEGAFYVWGQREIAEALGAEAELFLFHYGVKEDGNVEEESDAGGDLRGWNILSIVRSIEETADAFELSPEDVERRLEEARRNLFERRADRPRPHRDDKIITAWNGLMISAYARAYQVFDDPAYLEAATRAAGFIRDHLYRSRPGTLARTWRGETSPIDGFADDYAFLIEGLLDLYEAGFEARWLKWAVELQAKQDELFRDPEAGGYYNVTRDDASMLIRFKEDFDGAEPSPNSVAAMNLFRLAHMRADDTSRERGREVVRAFATHMKERPTALPRLLAAAWFDDQKPKQIVIAGQADADDTRGLLRVVHERFLPGKVLLLADGGDGHEFLSKYNEALPFMKPIEDRATAYICENFVCEMPVNTAEEVRRILDGEPVLSRLGGPAM